MENNYSTNPYNKPFTEFGNKPVQPTNVNAVPQPPYKEFTQSATPVQKTTAQPQYPPYNRVPVQPCIQQQPFVDYSHVSYARYENPSYIGFERQNNYHPNNQNYRIYNIPPQPYPYGFVQMPIQYNYAPVFQQQRKEVSPYMKKNTNKNPNNINNPNNTNNPNNINNPNNTNNATDNNNAERPIIGPDDFLQFKDVRDFRSIPIDPKSIPNQQNQQDMYNITNEDEVQFLYGAPPVSEPPNNQVTYIPTMPYPVTLVAPYTPQKKKISGGIIAIIIVLCLLFVGSLFCFFAFAFSNDLDEDKTPDSSFEFTIPESESFDISTNEQSDYSDKINPDYKGLDLKKKPAKKEGVSYNAEYANSVVADSVVAVLCYYGEIDESEEYASEGSGIIITKDGYVVTNSHVIDNSKTAYGIEIVTADGTRYKAGVVGFDERTDLALLKMDDAKNLTTADFCNLDQVNLGEEVICIGNPGGIEYSHSVTKGIVSAINRRISDTNNVKYIQTDAPINPGNSGGPVVNMYGQVIGIATSKIVSETYEGMGFAIPSNTVKEIIDELMRNGYVSGRVKVGINGFNITAQEAARKEVPQGIRIESIAKGGPCDGSGLRKDDIITKADGKKVKSFADFYDILNDYKAGDEIELTYYRYKTDTTDTVKITLQAVE